MLKSIKKKLTSDIVGNIENLFVGRHKSEHWFLQHKVVIAGKARGIAMLKDSNCLLCLQVKRRK